VLLYHGTDEDLALAILEEGFNLRAYRRHDAGILGWGVYLASTIPATVPYGTSVLRVRIDSSLFARIGDPHNPQDTHAEKLFRRVAFDGEDLLTAPDSILGPSGRVSTLKQVRDTFLAAGYAGIISMTGDVVVFDSDAILSVRRETS